MRATSLIPVAALAALTLTACTTTPAATTSPTPGDTVTAAPSASPSDATPTDATPTDATPTAAPDGAPFASAPLVSPQGTQIGTVDVTETGTGVRVHVRADSGLQTGFHGLHLHAIGKCEANSADPTDANNTGDFNSASGHLAGDGDAHPNHVGDLPPLYVRQDGSGELTTVSDRLTRQLVLDQDGTALIVHSGADNFANIPTRYASAGPDEETHKAGDAGQRVACAALNG
ncbi:superoxide dismutase family protein [Nigerium massiliense]|uniref:superoxide dismutase family protein n=1 Tax=Nigerium massiliense TaxID=1522317 RepID=UPI00058F167E|nr:superoxide dismutase family protein [Nigerium massiliense]